MHYREITFQKTFCLLGVIFFHALLPFTSHNPFWKLYAAEHSVVANYLSTFADYTIIPSFIFASGFLLANRIDNKQPSVWDNIKNRGKRLLVPWFLTMLFWLVPLCTLFSIPAFMHPADSTWAEGYRLGLQGRFANHLWFLLVLFWVSAFWSICLPLLKKRGMVPGALLAVVVAASVQMYGQDMSLYSLNQTSGPIIFLYFGYCAYHRQTELKTILTQHPARWVPAAALAMALLFSVSYNNFALFWLIQCCGCLLTYQLSLWGVRVLYPRLQANRVYQHFEKNSFRYYLFHMPLVLLIFMAVEKLNILPPLPVIACIFGISFAVTGGIVELSHILQRQGSRVLQQIYLRNQSGKEK